MDSIVFGNFPSPTSKHKKCSKFKNEYGKSMYKLYSSESPNHILDTPEFNSNLNTLSMVNTNIVADSGLGTTLLPSF